MKLMVSGSRGVTDSLYVSVVLFKMVNDIDHINVGNAKGVDQFVIGFAKYYGIPFTVFHPDWKKGRGAGLKTNLDMLNNSDALLAFHDGKSTGTKHAIDNARKMGMPVTVFSAT